jgi:hypothetical protein
MKKRSKWAIRTIARLRKEESFDFACYLLQQSPIFIAWLESRSLRSNYSKRVKFFKTQARRRAQALEIYLEDRAIDNQIEELEQIEHNLQYYDNE